MIPSLDQHNHIQIIVTMSKAVATTIHASWTHQSIVYPQGLFATLTDKVAFYCTGIGMRVLSSAATTTTTAVADMSRRIFYFLLTGLAVVSSYRGISIMTDSPIPNQHPDSGYDQIT